MENIFTYTNRFSVCIKFGVDRYCFEKFVPFKHNKIDALLFWIHAIGEECNCLSMLGLKIIHNSKQGPGQSVYTPTPRVSLGNFRLKDLFNEACLPVAIAWFFPGALSCSQVYKRVWFSNELYGMIALKMAIWHIHILGHTRMISTFVRPFY